MHIKGSRKKSCFFSGTATEDVPPLPSLELSGHRNFLSFFGGGAKISVKKSQYSFLYYVPRARNYNFSGNTVTFINVVKSFFVIGKLGITFNIKTIKL